MDEQVTGMCEGIGVLLIEEDEKFGVQIYSNPDHAAESFKNIRSLPSDPKRRFTMIRVNWTEDEKAEVSLVGCRILDATSITKQAGEWKIGGEEPTPEGV